MVFDPQAWSRAGLTVAVEFGLVLELGGTTASVSTKWKPLIVQLGYAPSRRLTTSHEQGFGCYLLAT